MVDEPAGGSVNRLYDMQVEEVSLVDRAANRHRFLVVKRDEEGAGGQEAAGAEAGDVSGEDAEPGQAGDAGEVRPEGALASATAALEALTAAVAELKGDPTVAVLRTLAGEAPAGRSAEREPEEGRKAPAFPDLDGVVTALRGLAERIGRLEKRFGTPNSRESAEKRAPAQAEPGWPMDMNSPHGRGDVDGSVSFHDV